MQANGGEIEAPFLVKAKQRLLMLPLLLLACLLDCRNYRIHPFRFLTSPPPKVLAISSPSPDPCRMFLPPLADLACSLPLVL